MMMMRDYDTKMGMEMYHHYVQLSGINYKYETSVMLRINMRMLKPVSTAR
jgi:hypothetical protein